MAHKIENDGWEVCAHRHTPMGTLPDISQIESWSWAPASLPFDAITWLSSGGRGLDPLVGNNDLLYRWTEDNDWVLRKQFRMDDTALLSDDEMQLVLSRVDCYFEVFLNGYHLGHGRNQFRSHTFDIDNNLLPDKNELIIYIRSARNANSMMETAYGQLPGGFDTGRVHARRCQSYTGWDWTARLSSVSVLDAPIIKQNLPIQIAAPFAYVSHLPDVVPGQEHAESAQINISIDLTSRRRGTGELTIRLIDMENNDVVLEHVESLTIKPKSIKIRRTLILDNPLLWWCLGMGNQPLYRMECTLTAQDRLEQKYELSESTVFGVRTIVIDAHKDETGETFVPVLNGTPIFCRGANWLPVSILPAVAKDSEYHLLIAAAMGAGINCLRVWGGGTYETDQFYHLCDKAGILVWQDFMFACAAYPTYREFMDEVEAEVIQQLQRLRNHACVMLWCGNNENEWLHQTGGLKKGSEQKVIGEPIWTHLIRQLVEDYDGTRAYHQTTPYGKNKADFNDQETGDRHSWEVWGDWQHTDTFLRDAGRFITEFGFQSLPSLDSIREFAPSAENMDNTELCHHQRMIEGQERIARYVAAHYPIPSNLDEWVKTTQNLQSEVLRRSVEHWRRRRFKTAGALIWHFHDGYPAISWSLIDFYRRPKRAYEDAKRFFSPVMISMELLIDGIEASAVPPEIWPTNRPETVPSFPIEGGDRLQCEAGAPVIQSRFVIINDTNLPLAGEVTIQFLRSESDPVVLDTVSVSIEPNGMLTALTHDIGPSMMKDIYHLTVRAHLELNDESKHALSELGQRVRQVQKQISPDSMSENTWEFDETKALDLRASFVDPKYFAGEV